MNITTLLCSAMNDLNLYHFLLRESSEETNYKKIVPKLSDFPWHLTFGGNNWSSSILLQSRTVRTQKNDELQIATRRRAV